MLLKAKVYNQEGNEQKEMNLNEAVFGVEPKSSVVHQVYVALRANEREPWADTKNRGEVRGGGRKPWKQKGTGRARHGSTRSPIWAGGGVTFGPLSVRNYKQKINKKMNQQALAMCLTDKVNDGKLLVIESLPEVKKTKLMNDFLKKLACQGRSALLLVKKLDIELNKVTKNLSDFTVMNVDGVNVVDLLHNNYVLLTKEALTALEKRVK